MAPKSHTKNTLNGSSSQPNATTDSSQLSSATSSLTTISGHSSEADEPEDQLNIPSFYNNHLMRLFDIDPGCTDESEWYGPWNHLLVSLFPAHEGFNVAPHHLFQGYRGEPDSTVYYIVKIYKYLITCVIQIKPGYHYDIPGTRLDAYDELKRRLQHCLLPNVRQNVQTVYGLSCIGDRFMVMKIDTNSVKLIPSLPAGADKVAPKEWWRHKVLRLQGCRRLLELVQDVKVSLNEKVEYDLPMVPIVLPEDESDNEKSDDDEERKRTRKMRADKAKRMKTSNSPSSN